MYVCVEHLCSRRPGSLDCHGGANMGMYHCALENITVFSCAQNESVIATDHELSVAVSSKRSGPECVMYIGNCCIRTGYFVLFHLSRGWGQNRQTIQTTAACCRPVRASYGHASKQAGSTEFSRHVPIEQGFVVPVGGGDRSAGNRAVLGGR